MGFWLVEGWMELLSRGQVWSCILEEEERRSAPKKSHCFSHWSTLTRIAGTHSTEWMAPTILKTGVSPVEGFGPHVGLHFMLFYSGQRDPEIIWRCLSLKKLLIEQSGKLCIGSKWIRGDKTFWEVRAAVKSALAGWRSGDALWGASMLVV